ncbi:MAG: hypothetical protein ACI81T_001754 [Bacteroidia bacterium]|jgi:hypothetical protein
MSSELSKSETLMPMSILLLRFIMVTCAKETGLFFSPKINFSFRKTLPWGKHNKAWNKNKGKKVQKTYVGNSFLKL